MDVIVIGGGIIGASVAAGLAGQKISVAMLDEGDIALRASVGNAGLVWFHSKGLGMQRYVDWSLQATQEWPDYAKWLEEKTGANLGYHKPGGLFICRGDAEFEQRIQLIEKFKKQSPTGEYDCELIDRRAVESFLPKMKLGPTVTGGTYSPHEGHVDPLALLSALHQAFIMDGGQYHPNSEALTIGREGGTFFVKTTNGVFRAPKLVICAGQATPRLAIQLGITIPIRPQRGQVMVTERVAPILPMPTNGIRQSDQGSFILGFTNEEVGYNTGVTVEGLQFVAKRTVEIFPDLARLRIVRTWGALRPLAPDGFPMYQESEDNPGGFVIASFSGVSLSPLHYNQLSQWVSQGIRPEGIEIFSPRRFDV